MVKQMVYKPSKERRILAHGMHYGFDYYVVSYGTHPCCYVDVGDTQINGVDYIDIDIDYFNCHGGLTFSGTLRNMDIQSDWLIGWDYAHYNDHVECSFNLAEDGGKRWTTGELIVECEKFTENLSEYISVFVKFNDGEAGDM